MSLNKLCHVKTLASRIYSPFWHTFPHEILCGSISTMLLRFSFAILKIVVAELTETSNLEMDQKSKIMAPINVLFLKSLSPLLSESGA